jgi:hypothetical protein
LSGDNRNLPAGRKPEHVNEVLEPQIHLVARNCTITTATTTYSDLPTYLCNFSFQLLNLLSPLYLSYSVFHSPILFVSIPLLKLSFMLHLSFLSLFSSTLFTSLCPHFTALSSLHLKASMLMYPLTLSICLRIFLPYLSSSVSWSLPISHVMPVFLFHPLSISHSLTVVLTRRISAFYCTPLGSKPNHIQFRGFHKST